MTTWSPGLRSRRAPSPDADADLAGQQERLRLCAARRQAALDQQLVEPVRGLSLVLPGRRGRSPWRSGPRGGRRPRAGVPAAESSVCSICAWMPASSRPSRAAQVVDRTVVDEAVGGNADELDRRACAGARSSMRAPPRSPRSTAAPNPPVDDALLERHDELPRAGLGEDRLAVEWLGEPRVDHAHRPAAAPRADRRP